jgi:hypothetical protein
MLEFYLITVGLSVILCSINIWIDIKGSGKASKMNTECLFIGLIPIVNLIIILIQAVGLFSYLDVSFPQEQNISQDKQQQDDIERVFLKKVQNRYGVLKNIKYIGGHHSYSNSSQGEIYILTENLLYTPMKFDNSHKTAYMDFFEVPLHSIESVLYDVSEQVTLTRLALIGIASFAFKKKTYYLIINYTSDLGVKNQLIFETGSVKSQDFLNELNIQRNKAVNVNVKKVL